MRFPLKSFLPPTWPKILLLFYFSKRNFILIFSASTILFLIKFPKIHSFLFFLLFLFNFNSPTLATQSSDDFQLFVTIFVILLIIGLVISAAFALSLYFYVWYKRRENVGKQSLNNLNEYYKQQQKQQHVVKPVKRREAENVFWTEPQHTHTPTIMPQPKIGPSFSERATKSFSNLKNSIQTKWQNLNLGGTKRIASPSSTVFPVEKPSTTSFYIPAQSPDNYVTIPEYSTSPQIPQQIEERKRIKSILKKPKDNTKYSVITPSMCREAQQPIPRWQWNIREKSPYERVIEDRVEREENCVQGKLVAVERLVRTTTTTSKNASNQQNIYWPGTGLNRTFI